MRILAIESSAITASVAVVEDDVLMAEYTVNYKKTHSQTLLPMIDEVFKMTEMEPESIDVVAVSVGPGSFTGLRIGAATGKGIAFATGRDMVEVPTLAAMAYNMYGTDKLICPVMDAKRRHLYAGLYRFNKSGEVENIKEQMLISYEDLSDMINKMGQSVVFIGDGIAVAKDTFIEKLEVEYEFAAAHMNTQRAGSVAMLAKAMVARGETVPAEALRPDYLRPSQAEREKMGDNS
ncbi:MAG: tRNA (adenosine(37)-N6)-threonylcarbamoyltransferase complex dimerization subunit type 1 TsaB [Lachnospira sp.]|nr:tRNA (adenosine(37)-N6)-threonylcarbamoyltransferase complex dimerization subunit type 1 TsaB [Lachnospira sp.]